MSARTPSAGGWNPFHSATGVFHKRGFRLGVLAQLAPKPLLPPIPAIIWSRCSENLNSQLRGEGVSVSLDRTVYRAVVLFCFNANTVFHVASLEGKEPMTCNSRTITTLASSPDLTTLRAELDRACREIEAEKLAVDDLGAELVRLGVAVSLPFAGPVSTLVGLQCLTKQLALSVCQPLASFPIMFLAMAED